MVLLHPFKGPLFLPMLFDSYGIPAEDKEIFMKTASFNNLRKADSQTRELKLQGTARVLNQGS